jgi:hypothetical protein
LLSAIRALLFVHLLFPSSRALLSAIRAAIRALSVCVPAIPALLCIHILCSCYACFVCTCVPAIHALLCVHYVLCFSACFVCTCVPAMRALLCVHILCSCRFMCSCYSCFAMWTCIVFLLACFAVCTCIVFPLACFAVCTCCVPAIRALLFVHVDRSCYSCFAVCTCIVFLWFVLCCLYVYCVPAIRALLCSCLFMLCWFVRVLCSCYSCFAVCLYIVFLLFVFRCFAVLHVLRSCYSCFAVLLFVQCMCLSPTPCYPHCPRIPPLARVESVLSLLGSLAVRGSTDRSTTWLYS